MKMNDKFINCCKDDNLEECMQLLEENNIDINYENDSGDTALIWASYNNNFDLVKLLLQQSANVNIKYNRGVNALSWAVGNHNQKMILLLLEFGAYVNHRSNSKKIALNWVIKKYGRIFNTLIKNGSLINDIEPSKCSIEIKKRQFISHKINDRFYQIIKLIIFYL